MSEKDAKLSTPFGEIVAGVREFLLAPLKRLYYIGHILFLDLPRFLRRLRGGQHETPIAFRRLAEKAITFHEACRLIDELNRCEGLSVEKPPVLCEELRRLLYQDLSREWRLPTPKEIAALSKELAADAAAAKLPTHPALFVMWTLGEGAATLSLAEIRSVKRYAYAVRTLAGEENP